MDKSTAEKLEGLTVEVVVAGARIEGVLHLVDSEGRDLPDDMVIVGRSPLTGWSILLGAVTAWRITE